MPVLTTVPDKAVGDPLSESNWDIHLRDNINYLIDAGASIAVSAGAQTINVTNRYHAITTAGSGAIRNILAVGGTTPKTGQPLTLYLPAGVNVEDVGGGTGNIDIFGDFSGPGTISLVFDGATWREMGRGTTPSLGIVKLSDSIVSVAGSSFDVTGIPGTYRSLMLVAALRSNGAGTSAIANFNGDSGANYNSGGVYNGTTSVVGANTSGLIGLTNPSTDTAGKFSQHHIMLVDYAATDKQKGFTGTFSADTIGGNLGQQGAMGGNWRNSAAINRIQLTCTGGFAVGSRLAIYGVS